MTFRGFGVLSGALFCVVLTSLMAVSQDASSETGSRIAPLVRNALDAAIPSTAVFEELVWRNLKANQRISRSDFETIMRDVRSELQWRAKLKLQPVSELSTQLDAITHLLADAVSANLLVSELQGKLSAEQVSDADWSDASTVWLSAGRFLQRIEEAPDDHSSPIHDHTIQEQIVQLRATLIPLSTSITRDMASKNLKNLQRSVPRLGEALSRLHIVASLQVYFLYGDFDDLAQWTNGMGVSKPPDHRPLSTLRQYVTMPLSRDPGSDK